MKKNGFTIVELLAVISLLVLGTIIIVPSVFSSLDRAKLNEYDRVVAIIEDGAESYYLEYKDDLEYVSTTTPAYVSLDDLAKEGYVKKPLENPRSDGEFDYKTLVKIIITEDGFTTFEFTNAYFRNSANIEAELGESVTVSNSDIITSGSITDIQVDGTSVELPYIITTEEVKTYTVTYTVSSNQRTVTLIRKIIFS